MTTTKFDALLAALRARLHEFPGLWPAPEGGALRACVPVERLRRAVDDADFTPAETHHVGTCGACRHTFQELVDALACEPEQPVAEPHHAQTVERWADEVKPQVLAAARAQAARSRLPRDPHRDADAYSHAREQVLKHVTGGRARFDSADHLRAYMQMTAARKVLDFARREITRKKYEGRYERPDPAPDRTELLAAIRATVETFPGATRRLLGFVMDDVPKKEIAALLGVPLGTAYTRVERALADLRRELDRRGITLEDVVSVRARLAEGAGD
ncbi:MAG: sigma-70 family RNA polymerase sigma factor [Planctomycetes bacterium]|nr:sigma-70 family RNA polymerase sigma factor [Planctomycetota bacterium]